MKVIKHNKETESILIDTNKGFNLWVDYWVEDNDIVIEWNKYIFFKNNSLDMKIKEFQENTDNFDEVSNLVENILDTE